LLGIRVYAQVHICMLEEVEVGVEEVGVEVEEHSRRNLPVGHMNYRHYMILAHMASAIPSMII
jgi:hypothetical protein